MAGGLNGKLADGQAGQLIASHTVTMGDWLLGDYYHKIQSMSGI